MPANKHVIVSQYQVTVSQLDLTPTTITLIAGLPDATVIEMHDVGGITLADLREAIDNKKRSAVLLAEHHGRMTAPVTPLPETL